MNPAAAARARRPPAPGLFLYAFAWTLPAGKLCLLAALAVRHQQPTDVQDVLAVLPEIGICSALLLAARAHDSRVLRRLLLAMAASLALLQWIVAGAWAFAGIPVGYGLLARLIADPAVRQTVVADSNSWSTIVSWLWWMVVSWSVAGSCVLLLRRRLGGEARPASAWLLGACIIASIAVTANQPVRPEHRLAMATAWSPGAARDASVGDLERSAVSALLPPSRQARAAPNSAIRHALVLVLESMRRNPAVPLLSDRTDVVRFERAYVHHPRSVKTLEALLFGIYPSPGLDTAAWDITRYDTEPVALPRLLEKHGLKTFYIGASPLESDSYDKALAAAGISSARSLDSRSKLTWGAPASEVFTQVLATLDDAHARGERGFVMAWTAECHMPYDFVGTATPPKPPREQYFACQRTLAEEVRGLVEALDRRGRLHDTLVMILGDHGQAFGDDRPGEFGHGVGMLDVSLRVPAIMLGPGLEGRVDDGLFQPVDVPATLAAALGVPIPQEWVGRDTSQPQKDGREFVVALSLLSDGQAAVIDANGRKFVRDARGQGLQRFDLLRDDLEQHPLAAADPSARIATARMTAYEQVARRAWARLLKPTPPGKTTH